MAAELVFIADATTARITPEALRVMLNQNGLRCSVQREAEQVALVLDDDQTPLKLQIEDGFVTRIAMEVTFVDEDAPADRVCEMLEMLGWVEQD